MEDNLAISKQRLLVRFVTCKKGITHNETDVKLLTLTLSIVRKSSAKYFANQMVDFGAMQIWR